MIEKIHISTFEAFNKVEDWRRSWAVINRPEDVSVHDKRMLDQHLKRNEFRKKFPFSVILEGVYPEHDFVNRWCWQNIGPMQCEECQEIHSEYPGCPLILATEYMRTDWFFTKGDHRKYRSYKAYISEKVPEHGHDGTWLAYWLGKTGYDYGFGEYYFQNELDRDKFLAAIPIFSLGEQYEKESEMTTTIEKVYQSKFGYHPISFEASKKLRFINGVFAKAQHLAGAWERWNRKLPHNRVMKMAIRDENGRKIGTEIVKNATGQPLPLVEPQICPLFHVKGSIYARSNGFGERIMYDSRKARTPQPTPEDVQPCTFTEQEIDKLFEAAKSWIDNF